MYGTYLVDLGKIAAESGYNAVINIYKWFGWSKEVVAALKQGRDKLISALNAMKKDAEKNSEKNN